MRDLPLALMFVALGAVAMRRAWLGLLGLVFVAVMHPQGYAAGWLKGIPLYFILGLLVVGCAVVEFVRAGQMPRLFWDWRLAVAAVFGLHMVVTTWLGINPGVGWIYLADIAKIIPLVLLVLILIDTREKFFLLIVTIAASVAAFVLKGGYWALITGFRDRVYGPPTSEFADNNALAVGVAMAIPLMALCARHVESEKLRWVAYAMVALGFAAALSSWSRGGLLSCAVAALLLVWHSRRKWLALPLLIGGIVLVFGSLPEAWFARMQTLSAPTTEGSAASRLEVWRLGWAYALAHPVFGGGLGSWIYLSLPTGGHLAWHSAYVSIAVEHGFVGLALWCALLFGTLLSLTRMIWRHGPAQAHVFWADASAMLRASLAVYLVGAAFLSIAYWEYLYLLLAAAIIAKRIAGEDEAAAAA